MTSKGGSRTGASPAIWLPLAVALVVATAAFALYLSGRPPGDDSAEAGFARDMMVHHAQAVEMANIVKDKTEDDEIRTLATDIMLTQQAQIGQMQGWLNVWGLPMTGSEPQMAWMGMEMDGRMPGMATSEQVNELRDAPPEEADRMFLRLMIPHHQAAVPMSGAILERTDRPAVEQLAEAISTSQRSEIRVMEGMLEDRGGSAPEQPMDEDMQGMDM